MAFNNRNFSGNGRTNFQRGGSNFQRGDARWNNDAPRNNNNNDQLDLRGILWGNKYREQQNQGAPVLQGYATVGKKLRLVGFLNPSPDHRDNPEAREYVDQLAAEINAMLTEAQETYGIAFNLTFQDEEEWRQERSNASRNQGQSQQNFRRSSAPAPRNAPANIPFNQQTEPDVDPEPEAAPRPTAKPRARSAAKPAAAAAKPRARVKSK